MKKNFLSMIIFLELHLRGAKLPLHFPFRLLLLGPWPTIHFSAIVKYSTRTIKYFCSKHIWHNPGEYTSGQFYQTAAFYSEVAGQKYLFCNHLFIDYLFSSHLLCFSLLTCPHYWSGIEFVATSGEQGTSVFKRHTQFSDSEWIQVPAMLRE